jgi:hypothetical protein
MSAPSATPAAQPPRETALARALANAPVGHAELVSTAPSLPVGAVDPSAARRGATSQRPRRPAPGHAAGNLESEGQSARMRVGIIALAVALGLVLALQAFDAPRLWRLSLFLPFFLTLFGATQALYRTCPSLAARGVREVCGAEEPVVRAAERDRSRSVGHRILLLSTVGAALATAVFVLMP